MGVCVLLRRRRNGKKGKEKRKGRAGNEGEPEGEWGNKENRKKIKGKEI